MLRWYDRARRRRTSAMLAASTRMNRMLTLTGVPAVVRNAVLRAVPDAWPPARWSANCG